MFFYDLTLCMLSKARIFLLVDLREFFSDLGSVGRKKIKSSENDQSTGQFQQVLFYYLQKKQ